MAKNPHVVRKLKIDNIIDPKEVKLSKIMFRSLMDQLQLCSATSSLQILFAQPTFSFKLFFPHHNQKRQLADKEKTEDNQPKKKRGFGSVINKTGKKVTFPKGMEKKYCADFLDVGEVCKHGDNCIFTHALYPNDFTNKDKALFKNHVDNTDGLSFKNVS